MEIINLKEFERSPEKFVMWILSLEHDFYRQHVTLNEIIKKAKKVDLKIDKVNK